ncbi:DUF3347 domain-containing protein [Chryseobacterium pennipullorum]|uniref:Mercury transporter n=1 Tax=Chryseobacterium pennipullorum TaxID=2258963 RepID=A0A3D9B2S0_9FLAO|nr:DUF3347 domain-containing protein [Chryseobacterium pennipullorum]REC47482.1 mercury transporter [Chryseobacterium pennipullorum]
MKKSIWLSGFLMVIATRAQIKNEQTGTFRVKGECSLAKRLIEQAGNRKDIAKVQFDPSSKTIAIAYDRSKTTANEILKRIADAGFDNDEYFAPNKAYGQLPEGCRYSRQLEMPRELTPEEKKARTKIDIPKDKNQLRTIFDLYFGMKEAFVETHQGKAADEAEKLLAAMVNLQRNSLITGIMTAKEVSLMKLRTQNISQEKDIDKQRKIFADLSVMIHTLVKTAALDYPVYYQSCPMFKGGSNWLSKDQEIKNPFYGSEMRTCGSTIETIK